MLKGTLWGKVGNVRAGRNKKSAFLHTIYISYCFDASKYGYEYFHTFFFNYYYYLTTSLAFNRVQLCLKSLQGGLSACSRFLRENVPRNAILFVIRQSGDGVHCGFMGGN